MRTRAPRKPCCCSHLPLACTQTCSASCELDESLHVLDHTKWWHLLLHGEAVKGEKPGLNRGKRGQAQDSASALQHRGLCQSGVEETEQEERALDFSWHRLSLVKKHSLSCRCDKSRLVATTRGTFTAPAPLTHLLPPPDICNGCQDRISRAESPFWHPTCKAWCCGNAGFTSSPGTTIPPFPGVWLWELPQETQQQPWWSLSCSQHTAPALHQSTSSQHTAALASGTSRELE